MEVSPAGKTRMPLTFSVLRLCLISSLLEREVEVSLWQVTVTGGVTENLWKKIGLLDGRNHLSLLKEWDRSHSSLKIRP